MGIGISYTGADGLTSAFSAQGANDAMSQLRALSAQSEQALATWRAKRDAQRGNSAAPVNKTKEQRAAEREARDAKSREKQYAKFAGMTYKQWKAQQEQEDGGRGKNAAGGILDKAKSVRDFLKRMLGFNGALESKFDKLALKGESTARNGGVFGKSLRGAFGFFGFDGFDEPKVGRVVSNAADTDEEAQGGEKKATDNEPWTEDFVTRVFVSGGAQDSSEGESPKMLNFAYRNRKMTAAGREFALGKETVVPVCKLGEGGGSDEEYCGDTDGRVASGCESIKRNQHSGEPKYFSLRNFSNADARYDVTAKLDAADEAGYYAGQSKTIVPKYTSQGTETEYLDLLMRTFNGTGSKTELLEYARFAITLPKIPQGDGKSVGITTTSSTSGTTAQYGLKDFANPTIVMPQAFSLTDGVVKNIASGAAISSSGDESLVCILVRTNSGELQYRRVSIYGRSNQDITTLIDNYLSGQSSGGPTYELIRQWINDAITEALADGGAIKSAIADAVEEAISAHEQKAESETFANSHVP